MKAQESVARKYYQDVDEKCKTTVSCGRNLNLSYLQGKLSPCYHRDDTIRLIQKILLRKNKANVLLTVRAGCGKTAIVEGLAAAITQNKLSYIGACVKAEKAYKSALKKWEANGKSGEMPVLNKPSEPPLCNCVIYDLSLNGMVGGTKYRGEFEERIDAVIKECRNNPNVILFMDEIHHLCVVGATTGSVSAGEILKPALARKDICVIGATTEERGEIYQDKALTRRFTELEIPELGAAAAIATAERVLCDYCAYHQISTDVPASYLLSYVKRFLPGTVFPDNFINVVDETLAGAVLDELPAVDMGHFSATLSRMTGRTVLCTDEYKVSQSGANNGNQCVNHILFAR